jgi:hypothetical protein
MRSSFAWGFALAAVAAGCTHHAVAPSPSSHARCDTNPSGAQCSVRIVEDASGPYRCELGRFRIEPDLLELVGSRPVFVRWTVDNPSRFQFCAASGDGVRLKSMLVADHLNVLEAFASDDDEGARQSIKAGSPCKPNFVWNWANRPAGATYPYEVRFRDRDQRACVIDPWIMNGR